MIVFQDLTLRADGQARPEIRAALLASTRSPWRHDPQKESEIVGLAGDGEDIIVFVRNAGDDVAAASLFLVIAHVRWVGMVSRAAGSGRIFGSTTALGYESRVA